MNILASLFSNTFVAFLILISIIVVIHELGHFLVGRLLGIGVEEFSVGFGPKALSFKMGSTVYRLNWLPLGGYVRFYGADTTVDISPEDRERSILHAKLYKRMLVAIAGPFANFVLSLIIMFGLYSYGVTKHPAVLRVLPESVAYQDGLRSGDRVVAIDGKEVSDWGLLTQKIALSPAKPLEFEVARNEEYKTITVTPKSDKVIDLNGQEQTVGRIGITPFFSIATIAPWQGQIFTEIGIQESDKIVAIDNTSIDYLDQFLSIFEDITHARSDAELAKSILKGNVKSFSITIERDNIQKNLEVDLNNKQFRKWAKNVSNDSQSPQHGLWNTSVVSSEMTIDSFDDLPAQNKLYNAKKSLLDCGLKSKDTIRRIDDSSLFASQVDFYSWLESKTSFVNKHVSQFKNNSINVNILVTDQNGQQSQYSCYLPIRHANTQMNSEKLFIDFPITFVSSPITYPASKLSGDGIFENLKLASKSVVTQTTFIYAGFKKLFSGDVPLSSLGGPIAIAGFAGDAAKAGLETFLLAMSLMSVNIGIFNLLPLPALDGGMLLLQIVEFFYRKPLPLKIQMLIARIGIAFLLTLFVFVFYNDIFRLFSNH